MTTDPRTAALAEALRPYEMPDPWTDNLRTIVMGGTAEEVAAAILAALPPSFFGDPDDEMTLDLMEAAIRNGAIYSALDQAEIARLNETLNSEIAECLRLRKIEEAARAFVDVWGETEAMESSHVFNALRAIIAKAYREDTDA